MKTRRRNRGLRLHNVLRFGIVVLTVIIPLWVSFHVEWFRGVETLQVLDRHYELEKSQSASHNSEYACRVAEHIQNYTGSTIWVPSYPGSGSELFRQLVEAATGFPAANIYDNQNCSHALTCKTHYPVLKKYSVDTGFDSVILLVRNPLRALPSYSNQHSEKRRGFISHTVQGREADWDQWREKRFSREIRKWRTLIEHWVDSAAVVVVYEDLMDPESGVRTWATVQAFLRTKAPFDAPNPRCAWDHIQSQKAERSHSYTPGFTRKQIDVILQVLQSLKVTVPTLLPLWTRYEAELHRDARVLP